MEKTFVRPTKSWQNKLHFLEAIESDWYHAVVELDSLISFYTTAFYAKREIKTMHLPITTGSISSPMGLGSDSVPVKIKLGGLDTYLADSMQFMLEYGCRFFQKGVYYVMPSFRGEEADKRHLSQFYHSEAEIEGSLEDVMNLVEDYIKYLTKNILKDYGKQLEKITGDNSHMENLLKTEKFPEVTFEEAVKILENSEKYIEKHPEGFRTINSDGEKELMKYFGGVVWLKNFDYMSVPFYQASIENDTKAKNADLLLGIGEVVGGGERHQTGDAVRKALKLHQVPEEEYEWYIQMKDKYPMQTAGFGMGVERFLLWITKQEDIRDCQLVPRFNGVNIIP